MTCTIGQIPSVSSLKMVLVCSKTGCKQQKLIYMLHYVCEFLVLTGFMHLCNISIANFNIQTCSVPLHMICWHCLWSSWWYFLFIFLMVIHAVAKIHYFEVQIFVVPAPTCFCEIVFIYWTGFLSKTALHCSVIF